MPDEKQKLPCIYNVRDLALSILYLSLIPYQKEIYC